MARDRWEAMLDDVKSKTWLIFSGLTGCEFQGLPVTVHDDWGAGIAEAVMRDGSKAIL